MSGSKGDGPKVTVGVTLGGVTSHKKTGLPQESGRDSRGLGLFDKPEAPGGDQEERHAHRQQDGKLRQHFN